jgi:hypothetical protein
MNHAPDRVQRDDLMIYALSPREWRISDSALPAQDSLSVLGFIEQKRGMFEAMLIGRGFEWFSFDTFEAAISHFVGVPRSDARTHVLASLRTA